MSEKNAGFGNASEDDWVETTSESKKDWVAHKISEEAAEDSLHSIEETDAGNVVVPPDASRDESDLEDAEDADESGPKSAFLKMPADLKSLRRLIDQKNKSIVRSLNRRGSYALEIAKVKAAQGLAIRDDVREKEVLKKISKYNKGPFSDEALHRIFNCIMEEHRQLEAESLHEGAIDAPMSSPHSESAE